MDRLNTTEMHRVALDIVPDVTIIEPECVLPTHDASSAFSNSLMSSADFSMLSVDGAAGITWAPYAHTAQCPADKQLSRGTLQRFGDATRHVVPSRQRLCMWSVRQADRTWPLGGSEDRWRAAGHTQQHAPCVQHVSATAALLGTDCRQETQQERLDLQVCWLAVAAPSLHGKA